MGLDTQLFLAVHSLTGGMLDPLMLYAADYLVLLVSLSLVLCWYSDDELRLDALYVFTVALVGVAASYTMGVFYTHQPPSLVYDTLVSAAGENAFPSQHTAVLFATSFGYFWRRLDRYGWPLLGASVLTGLARVYIGEHWPVDVLGGIAAAALGLGLVYLAEDRLRPLLDRGIRLYDTVEQRVAAAIKT
ncbi:MAG: phosphatase PAP2 family protein [Candidatus Nanohaloarchaea archaeon]|nr:phosphatase PAP2 family protein [Candidatus Nanohaloarchaea archaeon]